MKGRCVLEGTGITFFLYPDKKEEGEWKSLSYFTYRKVALPSGVLITCIDSDFATGTVKLDFELSDELSLEIMKYICKGKWMDAIPRVLILPSQEVWNDD